MKEIVLGVVTVLMWFVAQCKGVTIIPSAPECVSLWEETNMPVVIYQTSVQFFSENIYKWKQMNNLTKFFLGTYLIFLTVKRG